MAQEPIPPRLDLDRLARRERRWPLLAVAAVVAAFVLGGIAGWFGRETLAGGATGMRVFTADAIDAHKLYVVEVRHPVEVAGSEQAHLVQWLSKRLGYDVRAPDLGPIGLKLVGGRLLPGASGAGAALLMYEGPSGERFTIYCRRMKAPESALRYRDAGQVGAFSWVENEVAYVVSGPADRDRLHKVAEAAYRQLEALARTPAQGGAIRLRPGKRAVGKKARVSDTGLDKIIRCPCADRKACARATCA